MLEFPVMSSATLETFPNPRPGREYEIAIDCPEFTSVCPKTGLPDFGTIRITYVPDADRASSSSRSSTTWSSSANKGIFYESVTNQILDDLVAACAPLRMTVVGDFTPRGGIKTVVTARYESAAALTRTARPRRAPVERARPDPDLSLATVAPRCDSGASQNASTAACRSSTAWTMPRCTPTSAVVHESHLPPARARPPRGIGLDRRDVARRERVQVDGVLDRNRTGASVGVHANLTMKRGARNAQQALDPAPRIGNGNEFSGPSTDSAYFRVPRSPGSSRFRIPRSAFRGLRRRPAECASGPASM